MTDGYYRERFPLEFLQTKWFPMMTGVPGPELGLVFRTQNMVRYNDEIPMRELDAEFVNLFLIGGDNERRALHCYSSIARSFTIDFDFADAGSSSAGDLDAWWGMVRPVIESFVFHLGRVLRKRDVFGVFEDPHFTLPEPLLAWTGKRSIHVILHYSLRWHRAPTLWRKRLLEEVMELLTPQERQWVDLSASVAADSAKSLRVLFSPHVESETESVCTPLGSWSADVSKMDRHPVNLGLALSFAMGRADGEEAKKMQRALERVERWLETGK